MEGSWNHSRAYYRCQVHRDDSIDRGDHPSTIYFKENALPPGVDGWLAELFDDDHLDHTCEVLALADPDVKAAAYAELGITVTYHADGRALLESRPWIDGVGDIGVGGPSWTRTTRPAPLRRSVRLRLR